MSPYRTLLLTPTSIGRSLLLTSTVSSMRKYGLDYEEIQFIDSHVKEMD